MRKRKIIFVIACVLFLLALTWTILVSNGLLDKTDESIVEFTIKYRILYIGLQELLLKELMFIL